MDWFRHYHGCVFNPKWRTVARRTGATIERVAFVWSSLLEHASSQQGEARGSIATWDPEVVADHLMCDVAQLQAIRRELAEVGSIVGDRLEGWTRRQFASDSSAERVRRHRAAKRLNGQDTDPGATSQPAECNVTSAIGNAPEQNRTEQNRENSESSAAAPVPAPPSPSARSALWREMKGWVGGSHDSAGKFLGLQASRYGEGQLVEGYFAARKADPQGDRRAYLTGLLQRQAGTRGNDRSPMASYHRVKAMMAKGDPYADHDVSHLLALMPPGTVQ